ncbi:MAG: 2-oxoacid:acceptor oxidoreductase family protein [Pseudomonadota bacterium]
MKNVNFVLGGLGGQGILFLTKVLAQAALDKGHKVTGAETHGMAQRGGSVVSHLRLGDVEGSLVRAGTADYLLALEENEAYRNIPFLAKGGRVYANASPVSFPREEARGYLERSEILCRSVKAGEMASELGVPMSSNLVLLGFFAAYEDDPLTPDDLRGTVEKLSPDRFREINIVAFDAGLRMGLEER